MPKWFYWIKLMGSLTWLWKNKTFLEASSTFSTVRLKKLEVEESRVFGNTVFLIFRLLMIIKNKKFTNEYKIYFPWNYSCSGRTCTASTEVSDVDSIRTRTFDLKNIFRQCFFSNFQKNIKLLYWLVILECL